MGIKFYGYEKCSTCRKAQSFLNGTKKAYEAIDITQLPPNPAELASMVDLVGGEVKKLFNTSGVVYREMKLGDKLPGLSKAEALKLLGSNGRLVKRPVLIVDGKAAAVGFDPERWTSLGLGKA